MPVHTGYEIGTSLNGDGRTATNVRSGLLIDYINSKREYSGKSGLTTVATGNTTWGRFLPNCAQIQPAGYASSTYDLSNNDAFTIMMRVRIPTLPTPPSSSLFNVFYMNGEPDAGNFLYIYHSFDGVNNYLSYTDSASGSGNFTNTMNPNTWYHLAVSGGAASGQVKLYLDGSLVATIPCYTTAYPNYSYFGYPANNSIILQFTDFVVLKKTLTANQILCYSQAAFV